MPFLILMGACFAISFFFPRAANILAWMLTMFITFPIVALSAGTLSYFAIQLLSDYGWSWTTSMLAIGVPVGLLVSWGALS